MVKGTCRHSSAAARHTRGRASRACGATSSSQCLGASRCASCVHWPVHKLVSTSVEAVCTGLYTSCMWVGLYKFTVCGMAYTPCVKVVCLYKCAVCGMACTICILVSMTSWCICCCSRSSANDQFSLFSIIGLCMWIDH